MPTNINTNSGTRIGQWTLCEELGRGQFGVVFRAVSTDGRQGAIKLPTPSSDLYRLTREGHIIQRVQHPNLVALLDRGADRGRRFIALEFLTGPTLAELLDSENNPMGRGLKAVAEAARGLHAIHTAGYVHRDIKTANIVLGDNGAARLVDLGLAGDLGIRGRQKIIVGTPCYIAPEVFKGEPATVVSDIYALGVVLFIVLTGALPYRAKDKKELARKVLRGDHGIDRRAPNVPLALRALVQKAMHKDPNQRHKTAAALARHLLGTLPLIRHRMLPTFTRFRQAQMTKPERISA